MINRTDLEQSISDTIFDKTADQETAAQNLKSYTIVFDLNKDFQIQIAHYFVKIQQLGSALFTNSNGMSEEQVLNLASNKPWKPKPVNSRHQFNFVSKHRIDFLRMYSANNKDEAPLNIE